MRTVLAVAIGSLAILSIAATAQVHASVRQHTDIPEEHLGDALRALAHSRGVQLIYFSDDVEMRHTEGAVGELTVDEALEKLLNGSGLEYRYVDDNTISIYRHHADHNTEPTPSSIEDGTGQSSGPSVWNRFRLADANSASPQQVSSEPASLQEVVVTAQKREQRLQDVPVPVAVIDASNLADTNQTLLREYYSSVPGLTAQADIVAGQFLAIRGITTGGGNPTVGITIDDAPFNGTLVFTEAGQIPDIDPGDLERIEVLRGPQGTLYGANSMGGLMKFVTKDPSTDALSGRIEGGPSYVYNGAQPGYNIRGSVNIPVTDTLAIRASGFTRQDPGYINNPVLHINGVNETQTDGARLSALWRPLDTVSLKLSALYQFARANGIGDVEIAPGLGPLQQNYLPGMGANSQDMRNFSAVLNAKMGDVQLTSITAYGEKNTRATLDFSYAFGPLVQQQYGVSGAPFTAWGPASKFSQELRLTGSLWQSLDWLVGAFYGHDHATNRGNTIGAEDSLTGQIVGQGYFDYSNPENSYTEEAGFVNLTYHITDRFDLQVGGRETHGHSSYSQLQSGPFFGTLTPVRLPDETTSYNVFTYLVTPQFKLSQDFMAYARFASGFRPGLPNVVVLGVPPASSPDKTQNYELGLKADFFERRLSLDTSLYYIDWKNIQLSLNDNGIGYYANAGGAKSEGVEFSIESNPLSGLTVAAWIAYDKAVLTKTLPADSGATGAVGDRLPVSPRISGHLSLNRDFPLWQSLTGFVGAEASYVGYREGNFTSGPRTPFPAYTKTDVRAGFRSDSWTVSVYANNIANVRGLVGGGEAYDPPNALVYIIPRTIGVTVIKSF